MIGLIELKSDTHERNTKNRSDPADTARRTGEKKPRNVSSHQIKALRVRVIQSRKETRGFIDRRL